MPRARSRSTDSDDFSNFGLRSVSPSPLPSPASSDTPGDTFPGSWPSGPAHPTSTSSRTPAYFLSRTQKYSSYAFLGFLGVHLPTAALSPLLFGPQNASSSLLLARTYFYQASPIVEAVLIPGALGVHVLSGLGLRLYRHLQRRKKYGGQVPKSLSLWKLRNVSGIARAGWLLVPCVAAHAGLLRLTPLLVDGDSSGVGLEYMGYGFWREWPWGMWAGCAFYTVFVGAAAYHAAMGVAQYWGLKSTGKARTRMLGTAAGGGAVVLAGMIRIIRGSGGVGGHAGRHYEKLYRAFFRL